MFRKAGLIVSEKKINLAGQNIDYTLRINPKAKRLRLAIYSNGALIVTQPRSLSGLVVEDFIISHADWILKKIKNSQNNKPSLLNRLTRLDYLRNRAAARSLIIDRLQFYNKFYNYDYGRITIRNQKTRWGSCSKEGNLSFNFRLYYLSARLQDYVIVHELCHLKEFNHSLNFWRLVARTIPDYKKARQALHANLGVSENDDIEK